VKKGSQQRMNRPTMIASVLAAVVVEAEEEEENGKLLSNFS
jgi:hypothetical protein